MSFFITLLVAISAGLLALLPILGPDISKSNSRVGKLAKYWKYLFIACVLIAIVGSIHEYRSARRELFRLSPSDIQLRMYSEVRSVPGMDIKIQPIKFRVFADLGGIEIITEFERIEETTKPIIHRFAAGYNPRIHGSAGIDEYRFDYFALRTTLSGLENYPFLDDLDGAEFSCQLPVDKIQSFGRHWEHHLDIFIMGRHFEGDADSTGVVNIRINL